MAGRRKRLEREVADQAIGALETWLSGYTESGDGKVQHKITTISNSRDITGPREVHTGRALNVIIGEGYRQEKPRSYTVQVWVMPLEEEED